MVVLYWECQYKALLFLLSGGEKMAVSYNKLWKMMIDKHISKTELTHLAGISTNAMAKLGRDEDVRVQVLEKLCTSLDCKLDDIVEFVPDSETKKWRRIK